MAWSSYMCGSGREVYLSVVAPAYNEEANIGKLVEQVKAAMAGFDRSWELVIVDDGSTDSSVEVLRSLMAKNVFLRVVRMKKNSGQSAAVEAGIRHAYGSVIATTDSDLQNDPNEIPRMAALLKDGGCDFVNGWRRRRNDPWIRLVSTKIANGVRNWLTSETIHDSACGLKVFRRECLSEMKLFNGMHRFLPTLAKLQGYKVVEVEVNHRPRVAGKAKYGVWNRVFCGFRDIFGVRWMASRLVVYEAEELEKF